MSHGMSHGMSHAVHSPRLVLLTFGTFSFFSTTLLEVPSELGRCRKVTWFTVDYWLVRITITVSHTQTVLSPECLYSSPHTHTVTATEVKLTSFSHTPVKHDWQTNKGFLVHWPSDLLYTLTVCKHIMKVSCTNYEMAAAAVVTAQNGRRYKGRKTKGWRCVWTKTWKVSSWRLTERRTAKNVELKWQNVRVPAARWRSG